jgi:hypothetical protein
MIQGFITGFNYWDMMFKKDVFKFFTIKSLDILDKGFIDYLFYRMNSTMDDKYYSGNSYLRFMLNVGNIFMKFNIRDDIESGVILLPAGDDKQNRITIPVGFMKSMGISVSTKRETSLFPYTFDDKIYKFVHEDGIPGIRRIAFPPRK